MEVGQTKVLNELTKSLLNKYKPKNFALLGCATGNGLEHVDQYITKNVYAIDINPDYLRITKNNFDSRIKNLVLCNIDIRKDELTFSNIALFIISLVLEYTDPRVTLQKILPSLNHDGILAIIIQKKTDILRLFQKLSINH